MTSLQPFLDEARKRGPWLAAACVFDAALQFAGVGRHPFAGIGILALPLAPLVITWYALVTMTVVGGFLLGAYCLAAGRWAIFGVALLAVSTYHVDDVNQILDFAEPTPADDAAREACAKRVDHVHALLVGWLSVPRRVVSAEGTVLHLQDGPAIDVCPFGDRRCWNDSAGINRREAFGLFANRELIGQLVEVRLPERPLFRSHGIDWCRSGELPTLASAVPGIHPAEVRFKGARLSVSDVKEFGAKQ